MHLAREAVHAEAVRPVGRDLQVEHLVGDLEMLGERRARRQVVREDHDPGVVLADPDLVLGEDHSVGDHAPELRLGEHGAVGHRGARAGDGDRLTSGHIRRAADDRPRGPRPVLHLADREPVGVRMRLGRDDLANDELVGVGDAGMLDPPDLAAGHVEAVGDVARG